MIQEWVCVPVSFRLEYYICLKKREKCWAFLTEELNILFPWRHSHCDIVLRSHQHPQVNFNSLKKAALILPLMVKFVTLMKFPKLDSSIVSTGSVENIDLVIKTSFSSILKEAYLWASNFV